MAANKGNQFWKRRSKHGRDKLFSSPELLEEEANKYFSYTESHPEYKAEQNKMPAKPTVTKDKETGEATVHYPPSIISLPTKVPFSLKGLCLYLNCSESYFRVFKKTIADKEEATKEDKDFLYIIERIEDIVYVQQYNGAASGFFNANIISRALGLSEKTENKNTSLFTGKVSVNVTDSPIPFANSEKDVDVS